jgi:hypothetical protein
VHLQKAGCTLLNRETVHTIYPPLAQLWFLAEHFLIPQSTRDRGYESVGLLIVVATTGLLLAFLYSTKRDIRQVVIWACCPAVAIEAVQNAHIDGLAVLFVVLGAWMAEREQWTWAAAAVGAAGLIKLYPLVFFPALVQGRRVRGAVVIAVMFAVAYLPHLIAVGGGVTGFLGPYVHQEGFDSGRRYQLLSLLGLHGKVALVVAVGALLVVAALAFLRVLGPPTRAALILFAVILFVSTPGEPWEDLTLVALAAMTGIWRWLTVVVAEEAGYVVFIFGGIRTWAGPPGYGIACGISAASLVGGRLLHRTRRPGGDSLRSPRFTEW